MDPKGQHTETGSDIAATTRIVRDEKKSTEDENGKELHDRAPNNGLSIRQQAGSCL